MTHAVESMFSVKTRPWHGLGKVLENAPSIEEGIKEAGLDWEVKLSSMSTRLGGEYIKVPDKKAVVRSDNNTILGIVGENYKPLQNSEAFTFFEPFLENNLATLETAGSLFNGKKIFILAKINQENMVINEHDQVEKYILLSNGHDGFQSLRIGFTPIRVVCNNTLSMAESSAASQLIKVTHKKDIIQSMDMLRETMDLVNQQFLATEEQYKYLATRSICKADLAKYVKQVFSCKKLEDIITDYEEKQEIEAERKRLIARVEEIFDVEPAHNAWTMYNSVNYYLNHERSKSLENRYNQMWFGYAKTLDKKSLQLALTY